jgi:hypothetical protein
MPNKWWKQQQAKNMPAPEQEPKPLEESPLAVAVEPAPQPWGKKRWKRQAVAPQETPAAAYAPNPELNRTFDRGHHPDPFPERANPAKAPADQPLQQTELAANPVVNPRQVPRYYQKP